VSSRVRYDDGAGDIPRILVSSARIDTADESAVPDVSGSSHFSLERHISEFERGLAHMAGVMYRIARMVGCQFYAWLFGQLDWRSRSQRCRSASPPAPGTSLCESARLALVDIRPQRNDTDFGLVVAVIREGP
jgi:hypothetical protein